MDKPGFKTSEFFIMALLTAIALASGFSVVDGVTQYSPNMDLLNQLFLAGLGYMGLRGGGKIVQEARKQPTAKEVATEVLTQIKEPKA